MLLNIPTNAFLHVLTCANGLVVFAYFARRRCDPLANHDITNPNQVLTNHDITNPNQVASDDSSPTATR